MILWAQYPLPGIQAKELTNIKDAFKKGGVSVSLGVWFDVDNGDYLGFTITPAYGKGIGIGGYTKGSTVQVP